MRDFKSRRKAGFFYIDGTESSSLLLSVKKGEGGSVKTRYWTLILIMSGGIIGATSLFGLPRFSAQAEQKCNLCHMSPTGGGMRNGFGAQFYAQTEMAAHETPFDEIENLEPQISKTVWVGMDMRTLYFYDESSEISSNFQMEGNLYAAAQLDKRFSVTMDKELYHNFEVFGQGYIFPENGYFRIGKFQPAYGWRFADHTSFVRERMLWPAGYTDTGIEFGVYPNGISANIGFFNGTSGTFDDGKGKAVASRLEIRKHISKVGLGLGGSFYFSDGTAGDHSMYGPLYYLNLGKGKLIYLGEVDWLDDKSTDPAGIISMASTQNLDYLVRRGLWLELGHDFFDSNIDLKSGSISRYSLGIDYFPYAFLELEPMFRYYDDTTPNKENYILFDAQFHFFF